MQSFACLGRPQTHNKRQLPLKKNTLEIESSTYMTLLRIFHVMVDLAVLLPLIFFAGCSGCSGCSDSRPREMPTDLFMKAYARIEVVVYRFQEGKPCTEDRNGPTKRSEIEKYFCEHYGYTIDEFRLKWSYLQNISYGYGVSINLAQLTRGAVSGPCTEEEWDVYFQKNRNLIASFPKTGLPPDSKR